MKNYKGILCLILGIVTMALSNGKYLFAPAAFMFPLLFLLSFDTKKVVKSSIILFIALGIGNGISFYGMLPDVGIEFLNFLPIVAGSTMSIAFIFQMIAFKKSNTFSTTLILPSIFTLLDFANANFNPFGGFGLLGYSQHHFLAFAQLASIIGALGLTFLITFFGSVTYWMIKNGKLFQRNKQMFIYAGVILVLLSYGTIRLSMNNDVKTFNVSGIHTLDRTVDETAALFSDYENNPERFIIKSKENLERIIDLTKLEASKGANIVNHAEATIVVAKANKDNTLKRLQETAIEENIIIVTSIYVLNPLPEKNENVLFIIKENGEIALTHYKYGGNAFEGSIEGDKVLKATDSTYGRLSGIICWDKDFPTVVTQIGRLNVDTLFVPSADWKAISPYHTIVGTFRGLENGTNVVTQTVNGMSMIVDYKGRVISKMDHFDSDLWITRGALPLEGASTVYAYLGEYIGFILVIILLFATYKTMRVKA